MNRTAAARLSRVEAARDALAAKKHREYCRLLELPETATQDELDDALSQRMDKWISEYESEHGEVIPVTSDQVDWDNLSLLTDAQFAAVCKGLDETTRNAAFKKG